MTLLRQKAAAIREKRLHAISAYYGKPETLLEEHSEGQFAQRVRTFSQDTTSDILYVLDVVSTIKDAAIVIHGAAGCAVTRLSARAVDENSGRWAITNLNERDSILGSDVKLREAVKQINRLHSPKIIFIISTPVVAINNDDIESVVEELKDELGLPIVPIYTDGFRSKVGTTGYDLITHSIAKHVLSTKKEVVADAVNLLSISEKDDDLIEITRLLSRLGLKSNIFPRYTSLDDIQKTKNGSFSLSINPDESDYAGKVFEHRFNIPFIKSAIPIGVRNTVEWIKNVALATDRESEANHLVEYEINRVNQLIKDKNIRKYKVFISLSPAIAFAIVDLVEEFGFEVVGLKLSHIDSQHIERLEKIKSERPDFVLLVGDGQHFEEENVVKKINPELYIGNGGDFAVAIRNGIPAINLATIQFFGFSGVVNLFDKINKSALNNSFTKRLAKIESKSYTSEWLKKSSNWFIKQEVK